jgi:hypothetical protein
MVKSIGFFGDSFCEHLYHGEYKTYMELLKDRYSAEVVNIGMGGSSVWDLLIMQLNPLVNADKIPDVCVICWTIPARLFHRTCRSIHLSKALSGYDKQKDQWFAKTYPGVDNWFSKEIWDAAQQYFLHLRDQEKEELEYIAAIRYIDQTVLSVLSKKCKIINLWSFATPSTWDRDGFKPENISYPYEFTHGVELRPPLISLSCSGETGSTFLFPMIDTRANHLEGDKNVFLAELISQHIDNYVPGIKVDALTPGIHF